MTAFEQELVEAFRARFQAMGLVRAATWGNPERWSRDDLATDLAPWVAAAINGGLAYRSAMGSIVPPAWFSETEILPRQRAALAALRGEP